MKRKFLLPILSVCMVVALVSVGFAAWLITGNDTTGATGSFKTHEATNTYFTVSITPTRSGDVDWETNKIEFGKGSATTPNTTNKWFDFNGTSNETLEATFTIVIAPDVGFKYTPDSGTAQNANGFESVDDLFTKASVGNITIKLSENSDKYDTAKTNGYVADPKFYVNNSESATSATGSTLNGDGMTITLTKDSFTVQTTGDNAGKATATVKIKFGWGTAFNSTNPYAYYNGFAMVSDAVKKPGESGYPNSGTITYATAAQVGAENRTKATTALNALNALNQAVYEITPTVVSSAS